MPQILLIPAGGFLSIASAAAMGSLIAARTPLPSSVRFVTGAAVYAVSVFFLLACHAGYLAVYILLGGCLVAGAYQRAQFSRALPVLSWFYRALFAAYGTLYLIVALAPEIQEDAAGYHLRIVSDYVRLRAFSSRVTFYDVLPHGLEMLFVPAFAVGAHSAAKLVHFAFLIALVPLLREVAREAGLSDRAGAAVAALFFLAPVCGIAGTSAYTDMGLLCACTAMLYLLLRWRRGRELSVLLCAGIDAGFCFAIKPSFGWVIIPAFLFVMAASYRAHRKPLLHPVLFAAVASVSVVPWIARAWLLTGNPFAPFLNKWFPNAASTPAVELHLFQTYSAFRPDFSWARALFSYTTTGGNQGVLGPAFLLLPLAFLAIRRKRGRWLLVWALLLAVPFPADTGTRFLLPALVPAALALVSILPAPFLIALVAVQAVGSAPPVLALYDPGEWRIRDVPLRAALRIVPESDYLRDVLPSFAVGQLILRNTKAGSRIFVGTTMADSYVQRDLLFYWQSALADRITRALHFASISQGTPAELLSFRWPANRYRALRITPHSEFRVVASGSPPGDSIGAWQPWPEAAPRNVALNAARTGADLLVWPSAETPPAWEVLSDEGVWRQVSPSIEATQCCLDLRRDATSFMRRNGYRYLVIPVAGEGFADIGLDMAHNSAAWGVEEVDRAGNYWLFYIRPELF